MSRCGRKLTYAGVASLVGIALVTAAAVAIHAQEMSTIFLFAVDKQGVPLLDLEASDISIKEDVGPSDIVSVRRFGWPLKVTVLLDNGPGMGDALVHLRTGLKKFFAGLPPDVPVSLLTTAPAPRFLVRNSKDRTQIERAVNQITIDRDAYGRFSDSLIEYSRRLDEEFRHVSAVQMPPYLPVLVSIATTHQDGSQVMRDANEKMILSLRKHLVWTNMLMVTPGRVPTVPGELPIIEFDEGQNASIAKYVQDATAGFYVPITNAGTSSLSTTLLPELAQEITLRYIRQMMQHQIVMERPAGASGPMKNFALTLLNRPGAKIVVSTDGNMP
jgi:hypothetical protein